MNFYFLFLGIYSLLILPLTIRLEVKLGKGFMVRMRISVTGIPAVGRRFRLGSKGQLGEEPEAKGTVEETESDILEALADITPDLRRAALSKSIRETAKRTVHCAALWARVRISFQDAAATALCYASLSIFFDVLRLCGVHSRRLDVKTEVDFGGHGTQAEAGGILLARLGSLALVASMLAVMSRKEKAARKDKENGDGGVNYATTSH